MNEHRIPTRLSGLRISVQFPTRGAMGAVHAVNRSPVVCDQIANYSDGTSTGYIYGEFGIVRAFAQWLTPSADDFYAVRRAKWSCHNADTGEIEADVYPEFMADVMRKIARLHPRSLSVHSVSI